MTQHTRWTDEAINNRIEEMLERDVWSEQDFGRVIATDIRDDMAQEIAALKQELASALTEMLEVVQELGRDEAHVKFRRRVLRGRINELTGKEWRNE